jgi:hypothetical protein
MNHGVNLSADTFTRILPLSGAGVDEGSQNRAQHHNLDGTIEKKNSYGGESSVRDKTGNRSSESDGGPKG